METNLQKIEQLSRQREDENWRFRCYLKASDLSVAKIDAVVRQMYREVAAQIECTTCGNCCRVIQPLLTAADIKRLAAHLDMTDRQFRADYILTDSEADNAARFNAMPCPFLQENRCSVYDCRPRDCRSYPHLHKKDFVFRMNQAYSNCSVCPIIFNVYEGLKSELWRAGRRQGVGRGT
ncbi:MAG: YkgJ family cysteine cluster protein [Geobacteraceae bacterium]